MSFMVFGPCKVHKSVLVKNLCRSIHLLLRDLSLSFPCITITYSHVESLKNCADANCKVCEDPVAAINSTEWRNGHPYFMDPAMPLTPCHIHNSARWGPRMDSPSP